MASTIEVEAINLVLVGQFNPAIFTPHWLCSIGALSKDEADAAIINIIHPEFSAFQTSWFQIHVEQERCTILSHNAVSIRIFDFVLKLFGDYLPHTPLRAAGINYLAHFRVSSMDTLHRLGDLLAPKEPWGDLGLEMNRVVPKEHSSYVAGGVTRSGGLRTITMTQYVRPDNLPGFLQFKVEPSLLHKPGVFFEANDHYELNAGVVPIGGSAIINSIAGKFDESVNRARTLTEHFMRLSDQLSIRL